MAKPYQIKVRAYQVDFGDCFLLTFCYARHRDRHVLIDFGWTTVPKGARKGYYWRVARSIQAECGGKLDAVVVTHRHLDHLRGFDTKNGPGKLIAGCKPRVVVQPWTEHPKAHPKATSAPGISLRARAFVKSLAAMERVAEGASREAARLAAGPLTLGMRAVADEIEYLGKLGDGKRKKSPVENLMRMAKGGRGRYVHYGGKSGLERVLPGVKVRVLGPPTLEQSEAIRKETRRHDEYWHLQALATGLAAGECGRLFPGAPTLSGARRPESARWFMRRLQAVRAEQLLGIVRSLDDELNNTSVILLFEAGKQRLLFSGDAQIENWLYALEGAPDSDKVAKRLEGVTVYKVGHHGSLNGTPKSVWRLFKNRRTSAGSPDRLRTILSTEKGHHGKPDRETEVPRRTLVAALRKHSNLMSTDEDVAPADLFWAEVLDT